MTTLNVGDYADMISTNAPVTVTNGSGEDVTANYEIAFFPGVFTVTKAPIETPEPEKPTDPKPDDPQTPPAETDGPTIWAPDVTKVYDGIGTKL